MGDKASFILVSILSATVGGFAVMGVFYLCYPDQKALMGESLVCHAEYVRQTS